MFETKLAKLLSLICCLHVVHGQMPMPMAPNQMQMPVASFTTHEEEGDSTFAVYNGQVFKIPKKEEPSMFSSFFSFDNSILKNLFGWTEYFTGSSTPETSEPQDMNVLANSQNMPQFARPGQPNYNFNGPSFVPNQPPGHPGSMYPRPPAPWGPQSHPQTNPGNSPYGYGSQYPPRPVGTYQPSQPQLKPVQPPNPNFFPSPNSGLLQEQMPYSEQMGDYEMGPAYDTVSSKNAGGVNSLADDSNLKGFVDSPVIPEAMETNEIADKPVKNGLIDRATMDMGADNPCPTIGQWKWDGTFCVALGPYPRWACRPTDLVLTGRVTVCRNRVWFPNDR